MALQVLVFAAALWLGFYLLARDPAKSRLRWTGSGLVAYALAIAANLLESAGGAVVRGSGWQQLGQLLTILPALLWTGALLSFLPEGSALRRRLSPIWAFVWLPAVLVAFVVTGGVSRPPLDAGSIRTSHLLFAALILLPLLGGPLLLVRSKPSPRSRSTWGVLVAATIFFGLQLGWLLLPVVPVPQLLLLLGVGLDLFLLGVTIAVLDAFEEGEAIRRDMVRSATGSLLAATLFGGQVALFIFLTGVATFGRLALLLSTIALAIAFQTFLERIQTALDGWVFQDDERLVATRASYRAAAQGAPRLQNQLQLEKLDDETLVRLTRRALSHFGDLPRLSSSPLIRLPLIDRRLAARGLKGDTLERAAELKGMLAESIERLKPRGEEPFGTGDEWRHYNALYFPYVAGLRPYSRRAIHDDLDPVSAQALDWFRQSVPERTMYNWQAAAAALVAQDLKEKTIRVAAANPTTLPVTTDPSSP